MHPLPSHGSGDRVRPAARRWEASGRAGRRVIDARVGAALDRLTLGDQVGLALRDHRHRLGVSQRAYAALRGWGRGTLARLEARADDARLQDVVGALDGTGFALALVRLSDHPRTPTDVLRAADVLGQGGRDRVITRGGAGRFGWLEFPPRPDPAGPQETTHPTGPPEATHLTGPAEATHLTGPQETTLATAPELVDPMSWPVTELLARTRGIGRRFPAHRHTEFVTMAPAWWWIHEFFNGSTQEPEWYSPQEHPRLLGRIGATTKAGGTSLVETPGRRSSGGRGVGGEGAIVDHRGSGEHPLSRGRGPGEWVGEPPGSNPGGDGRDGERPDSPGPECGCPHGGGPEGGCPDSGVPGSGGLEGGCPGWDCGGACPPPRPGPPALRVIYGDGGQVLGTRTMASGTDG